VLINFGLYTFETALSTSTPSFEAIELHGYILKLILKTRYLKVFNLKNSSHIYYTFLTLEKRNIFCVAPAVILAGS